jgi:DNA mismatch endonuclease (patch repair protein)
MARVRQKNTAPELILRRALWASGLRYRLHASSLPGRPDIVFAKHRLAIFVHGCFWHSHGCARSIKRPKANADYWARKLNRNIERDRQAQASLSALGWRSFVVWECEDVGAAVVAIRHLIEGADQ